MDDKTLLRRAAKADAHELASRLRYCGYAKTYHDAADLLESQAARIAELEAALQPLAKDARMWKGIADDHRPMFYQAAGEPDHAEFTVGDLRRAAAALGGDK